MKVLLVSTSEGGGGGIAARRLLEALCKNGVEAKMMVRDKQSADPRIVKVGSRLPKIIERLAILPRCGFRRSQLWASALQPQESSARPTLSICIGCVRE